MKNKEIEDNKNKEKVKNKKKFYILILALVFIISLIGWWLFPTQETKPPQTQTEDEESLMGTLPLPFPFPTGEPLPNNHPIQPEHNLDVFESSNIIYDGSDTYFRNELDDWKLYVLHNGEQEPEKVMDEAVYYMTKVEEKILYTQSNELGIFMIDTDGSNKEQITGDSTHQFIVQDSWVYYVDASDRNRLTKVKLDGTDKVVLSDDEIHSFLIQENCIYYVNRSNELNLYKMKTDGSSRLLVSKDSVTNLKILDDWIYYLFENNIYKINKDGLELDIVSNEYIQFFQISQDWIYYRTEGIGGNLWRMKLDGTNKEQISISGYDLDFIEIWDDWVFYYSAFLNKELYHLDGETKKISEKDISNLFVHNNLLFYLDNNDFNKLYQMDLNGENINKIVDSTVTEYEIYDNKIYYRNALDENKLYETELLGENNVRVIDQRLLQYEMYNDQLYFIEDSDQQRLFQYDMETKQLTKITDEQVYQFYILNEKIFYTSQEGSNIVNLDGTDLLKLTSDIENPKILGDWIYYVGYGEHENLYRIKQDGSEQTKLTTINTNNYMILNDWIYYIEDWKLHKIKLDGSEKVKISDKSVNLLLSIENDWIYASSSLNASPISVYTTVFKVKTNGKSYEELINGYIEDLEITDKGILFTENQESYRTFKVNIDGSNESVLFTPTP
ncbi:DUF5050 domain-containing protein [Chengkuizengella marina]|uniref:DUF5050 domain-containing protein n=1 Tax=Chengkuizengella marina TaxID=2507566 RepID=A0A6N9Q6D2_9BACL|nr:DUF5050 domain-containing protein [Chengkuizengella marina]NBI30397.1 DUF5050 domain-containing protein [Chengkuizengella marina]